MQPPRASKSPFSLEIDIPITNPKSHAQSGELKIFAPLTEREAMAPEAEVKKILQSPVTKREMMAATAAVAAAATQGIAHAVTRGADGAQSKIEKPASFYGTQTAVKRGPARRGNTAK